MDPLVLDTSAIGAIILMEPGQDRLLAQLDRTDEILVGAPTVVGPAWFSPRACGRTLAPVIQALLRQLRASVMPFDEDLSWAATGAFLRFDRGRHPAALNFGNCLSYVVASLSGAPLLFTGDGLTKTDIAPA
jgi:ribonuclease VapC